MSFLKKLKSKARNFNLLYVEDEAFIKEKLNTYFIKIFKNVYTADDGIEALECFEKKSIDLIITDVNMPKMNGLQLSKKIKEIDSQMPIILLTANTDISCFIEAIDIGVDKFILKPINKEKLYAALSDIITVLQTKKEKKELEVLTHNLNDKLESKTKELNLFKDDMIAVFTHELKTPLHAIINFSNYIHDSVSSSMSERKTNKISELAGKIYSNAMFQSSLIETLLDVTKYKAGKMVLKELNIEPKMLINSVINRYQTLYNKQTSVELEVFDIIWDKKAFLMVLENIYSNALKYSKSKIHISFKKLDEEKFLLCIEDDGNGIEEEKAEFIFGQFEQLEESYLHRQKAGTGLGLYLVKLILDKCNAQINVSKSETLGGASFNIQGSIRND